MRTVEYDNQRQHMVVQADSPAFDFMNYSFACIAALGEPVCTFWSCGFDKKHRAHENAVLVNLVIVR